MKKLSGFQEAAALNTHDVIETNREPRNFAPDLALTYLMRGGIITKFHFHGGENNGVWTPKNIERGQILRCDLPTDYDRDGYVTLSPRNILCLGVDVDPETLEPIAIRALRFSYKANSYNSDLDLLISKSDPEAQYGTENTFTKDAILRTASSVDVIPFNSAYWGHFIEVQGRISPEYMPHIEDAIERGYEQRRCLQVRNHAESDIRNSLTLPALVPNIMEKASSFMPSEKVENSYFDLSAENKEELHGNLLGKQIIAAQTRGSQISLEKNDNKAFQRQHEQLEAVLEKARKDYNATTLKEIMALAAEKMAAYQNSALANQYTDDYTNEGKDMSQFEALASNSNKLIDMPTISKIIEDCALEIENEKDLKSAAVARLKGQKADKNSIEKLADFGIGGMVREPNINLHEYMWKGRYHMLRLPSLVNPALMDDLTNRPCALTRAWVRPDDNGDLRISHMAFIPCTRGESNHFKYKMKTKPLDTTVKKPTMLIAEMEIIVPVDAENFQPNQPDIGTFYELLPHQVDAMFKKRDLALEEYGELQYHGMRPEDIPEDCHEVELPDAPNEKLRTKFTSWGIARFVGDNKAPVKRPMRGSRHTARNFDNKASENVHNSFLNKNHT